MIEVMDRRFPSKELRPAGGWYTARVRCAAALQSENDSRRGAEFVSCGYDAEGVQRLDGTRQQVVATLDSFAQGEHTGERIRPIIDYRCSETGETRWRTVRNRGEGGAK